jgi:hypothetical protein
MPHKGRKHLRVLEVLKNAGGRIDANDPRLLAVLGDKLMYRIACYISDIRTYNKLDVKAIRNGRKVVAYELVAMNPPATEAETPVPAEEPAAV